MYYELENIDIAAEQGNVDWQSDEHWLVAGRIALNNPRVSKIEHLIAICQAVNRMPPEILKRITWPYVRDHPVLRHYFSTTKDERQYQEGIDQMAKTFIALLKGRESDS